MAYDKNGNIIRTSSKDVEIDALGGVNLDDAVKQKMFGNDVKDTLEGGEHNAPPSVAAVNTGLSKKADKADVDNKLSSKADKTSVDNALSQKADKSELASKADVSAIANKQDKLVNGSNIKTINNQSILGSGNINIQGGSGGGVDIDTTMPASPSDSKVPSTKLLAQELAKKANVDSEGREIASANDVDYNPLTQYRDGSVGKKLTELDKKNNLLWDKDKADIMMQNLTHRLRNSSFVMQQKQLVLMMLTDIHADSKSVNVALTFAKEYKSYINDIIQCGDLQKDNWADGIDWFSSIDGHEKILGVLGNHDATDKSTGSYKKLENKVDVYNRFFAPFISYWGVILPENAAEEGKMYYYKDYTEQKVRLIALDCMYYDEEQNTWLRSVLSDAKDNDYAVIVTEHYPIKSKGFEGCSFTSNGFMTNLPFDESEGNAGTLANAQTAIESFINDGGEFICWLAGHTHKDFCGTLINHPEQTMFVSDCSGTTGDAWGDSVKPNGFLFTLIGVDRYNKVIRFYRVGTNYDRYLRHKETMAIRYSDNKMIYCS